MYLARDNTAKHGSAHLTVKNITRDESETVFVFIFYFSSNSKKDALVLAHSHARRTLYSYTGWDAVYLAGKRCREVHQHRRAVLLAWTLPLPLRNRCDEPVLTVTALDRGRNRNASQAQVLQRMILIGRRPPAVRGAGVLRCAVAAARFRPWLYAHAFGRNISPCDGWMGWLVP